MYICVCNALTENCVRSALSESGPDVVGVFGKHGTKPKCGKCLSHLRDFMHRINQDQTTAEAGKTA